MKLQFYNLLSVFGFVLFCFSTALHRCYKFQKSIVSTNDQHADNNQASVSFYLCNSPIIRSYLRFYLPKNMFTWWLIYLNKITASASPEQREAFYNLWTGNTPIGVTYYREQWSAIHNELEQIYQNFNHTYHPEVQLQEVLRNYLISKDGFLKFCLTFTGKYQENNFFPTPNNYTEFDLQKACREGGCFFQIFQIIILWMLLMLVQPWTLCRTIAITLI